MKTRRLRWPYPLAAIFRKDFDFLKPPRHLLPVSSGDANLPSSVHIEAALALLRLDIGMLDSSHIGMLWAFVDMFDKLLQLFLRSLDLTSHLRLVN